MDDLAHYIGNWTDLPVVNRTAVSGLFTVNTEGWTVHQAAAASTECHAGGAPVRCPRDVRPCPPHNLHRAAVATALNILLLLVPRGIRQMRRSDQ